MSATNRRTVCGICVLVVSVTWPARVHLPGREDGVLDHDDAHAALPEPDGGLGHAHVGLVADEDRGPARHGLDAIEYLRRARHAERRLDERRGLGEGGGERRERRAVASRVLLGQHGRDLELARDARQPGHPLERVARAGALVRW